MASLAPGNGWYPNRSYPVLRPTYAPRRGYANVYAFPRARNSVPSVADPHPAEVTKLQRGETSPALRWPVATFLLGALAWLGLVAALGAAALGLGVPLLTAVAVLAATHLLAATLALLIGVRVGRKLLAAKSPALE